MDFLTWRGAFLHYDHGRLAFTRRIGDASFFATDQPCPSKRREIDVAIRVTAIRLSGGTTHQHIVRLWWTNPANGKSGHRSRAEMVSWIEKEYGNAYVEDSRGDRAEVGVVTPNLGEKYLRTYADRVWTDNLLALPRR